MLKSMTGFGNASSENNNVIIRVEIKSLNSKHLDLNIRVPRQFSEKEITLRSQLSNQLERGKINLSIELEYLNPQQSKKTLNKPLLLSYIAEIKEVAKKAIKK
jgi:uncharacterized protein (TIGR00255 family)